MENATFGANNRQKNWLAPRISMSILVGLHHATRYDYDRAIGLGPQIVRLRPAPHCRTRVPSYSLTVKPAQHFVNWQQDPHGNWLARFVFPEKTKEFSVTVDLIADMEVINPFDFFVEPSAEKWPFSFPPELREDLAAFVEPEPAGPLLAELIRSIPRQERNTVDFLVELNQRLQGMIRYLIRMEPGVQTPEETLSSGAGSCRDTAWLLGAAVAAHRSAGTFCLRLPRTIAAGHQAARRRCRRRARFHRPACLDRSLSARRRLDRARSDVGHCCAAKATCRSPRHRIIAPRRRSAASSNRAQ